MLLSKLLLSKKTFTTSVGEIVTDLISATFRFGESTFSAGPVAVNSEEAMRPDLLANRIYSDQINWESLLKYNGISNPFSLDEGEILLAPPFKSLNSMIGPPKEVAEKGKEPAKKNEKAIITPKTPKDKKRIESIRTKVTEVVPPNVNLSGSKNVRVANGVITFGGDITQAKGTTTNTTSTRDRIKEQLKNSNNF